MTMWLPDLAGSSRPAYLAIADAIADAVRLGKLRPGELLPTHRLLADLVGVNVSTVTRAYREAARRRLVGGEVGRGTFVLAAASEAAIFALEQRPEGGVIDLSTNMPPVSARDRDLAAALARFGPGDAARLLHYPGPGDALVHREAAAGWLRRRGVETDPDAILVCAGAQHAMDTALGLCAEVDGDRVRGPGLPGAERRRAPPAPPSASDSDGRRRHSAWAVRPGLPRRRASGRPVADPAQPDDDDHECGASAAGGDDRPALERDDCRGGRLRSVGGGFPATAGGSRAGARHLPDGAVEDRRARPPNRVSRRSTGSARTAARHRTPHDVVRVDALDGAREPVAGGRHGVAPAPGSAQRAGGPPSPVRPPSWPLRLAGHAALPARVGGGSARRNPISLPGARWPRASSWSPQACSPQDGRCPRTAHAFQSGPRPIAAALRRGSRDSPGWRDPQTDERYRRLAIQLSAPSFDSRSVSRHDAAGRVCTSPRRRATARRSRRPPAPCRLSDRPIGGPRPARGSP